MASVVQDRVSYAGSSPEEAVAVVQPWETERTSIPCHSLDRVCVQGSPRILWSLHLVNACFWELDFPYDCVV